MIKMPREITELINKFLKEGFQIYAVGGCVRDSLMGEKPVDWDLATDASIEDMKSLLPKGKVLSDKLHVMRVDFTKSEEDLKSPVVDIARFRKEEDLDDKGMPRKISFVKSIEEDLKRRDFTINALADNAKTPIVDLFNGRDDIKSKTLRTIGDADVRFKEDPLRMLRAVRLCAEKNFNIEQKTYEAIKKNAKLLSNISKDKIRDEFIKIVESRYVDSGFKMLFDTALIESIAGIDSSDFKLKKKVLLSKFLKNIQLTFPILDRRLAVFYSLIKRSDRNKAIAMLNYNKALTEKLTLALNKIEELGIIKNDVELKLFISEVGLDIYLFIDGVTQDKVVIYGGSPARINKRQKFMKKIKDKNEAIFIKDLALDGQDLKDEAIEGKLVGDILNALLLDVHRKPFINNRASLMKKAKAYAKSPFKRKLRMNKFLGKLR